MAGILILISARLAKAEQIYYRAHHAGRLLHARIPHGHTHTHVDILSAYQYAVNAHEATPERRQRFLVKLQSCLAHLPRRNALVLGGDFDCPCVPYKHVCGQVVTRHNDLHYVDSQDHQNVWRTLHLTALNTWQQPTHGQVATFVMGEHEGAPSSQIDFVFVPAQHATTRSKQASALVDYPVAAWRGGPRHYPILADIPAPVIAQIDREQMIQDLRSPTPTTALHGFRQEVQAQLPAQVDHLNDIFLQAAQKHFPLKKTTKATSQSEELANCARNMWGLFRSLRAHRYGMPGIINAWRQWTEFCRAHRLHKTRSKQRSKQRKQDLLQQAQAAATQGNVHKTWKIIRQLAPKARKKRLQLHKDGHMISPDEELDWILTAYGERYATDPSKEPITFEFPAHSGVFLDPQELQWHLEHLNPRKAVPKGTAPAIAWRICSDLVAAPVVQAFNAWQGKEPIVLQRWADADVALLPKAHGRSNSPLDWRPIGVQDPLGKCLMSTIVKQTKQTKLAIHDLIVRYTLNVFARCHEVREHCSKARITIHQQHEGEIKVKCHGGLQISLDLSAAFDLVEWSHLKQALDLAQVDIAVQEIMLTWLTQVLYLFRHRHLQGSIKPRRGLRQGCSASPILWAAFTSLLCVSIEARTRPEWTRQHLCLYADDSHLRLRFDSYEGFETAMGEVRIVFACFRLFHLKISMEKSKAILKLVGTLKDRVKKEYVRKHPTTKRLLLSPASQSNGSPWSRAQNTLAW
ncbi:unnamed protein product [Symbiodinium sp. CCMP2456]|nr:unnamed protein product [Symbiodinium sp. CCMP2456]